MCGHMLSYPLGVEDYLTTPDEALNKLHEAIQPAYTNEKKRLESALKFEETQMAEGIKLSEAQCESTL